MFDFLRKQKKIETPKKQSCTVYARNGSYFVKTCHYSFNGKGPSQETGPGHIVSPDDPYRLGEVLYKALNDSADIPSTRTMEESEAQRKVLDATLAFYDARSWIDLYRTSSRVTVDRVGTVITILKWKFVDEINGLILDGPEDTQEYMTPEKLGRLVMDASPMPKAKSV
jgi:hypothetical protein